MESPFLDSPESSETTPVQGKEINIQTKTAQPLKGFFLVILGISLLNLFFWWFFSCSVLQISQIVFFSPLINSSYCQNKLTDKLIDKQTENGLLSDLNAPVTQLAPSASQETEQAPASADNKTAPSVQTFACTICDYDQKAIDKKIKEQIAASQIIASQTNSNDNTIGPISYQNLAPELQEFLNKINQSNVTYNPKTQILTINDQSINLSNYFQEGSKINYDKIADFPENLKQIAKLKCRSNQVIQYIDNKWQCSNLAITANSFLSLTDTPNSYVPNHLVRVNSAGNRLEFVNPDLLSNSIQSVSLVDSTLTLVTKQQTYQVDLSSIDTTLTEQQVINYVASHGYLKQEQDADPTNELITQITLSGNNLIIQEGGNLHSLNLAQFLDNTDNQILTVTNSGSARVLSISGGNTVNLPDTLYTANKGIALDPVTNTFSLAQNAATNGQVLMWNDTQNQWLPATPATFSDTDEQTLSFNSLTNVLTISKSNSQVDLSSLNNLYQAGTGLALDPVTNTFSVNNAALQPLWANIQNIPADILDGDQNTLYQAGTGLTLNGTIFNLADTTVTPGVYNTVTVDQQGRITFGANTNYLTQETDPIFAGSPAHIITNQNITNWNHAFNWGNHALQGYLKQEQDADPTNELQNLTLTGNSLGLTKSAQTIDLTPYLNTDQQTLTVTGTGLARVLSISGGNTVNLPDTLYTANKGIALDPVTNTFSLAQNAATNGQVLMWNDTQNQWLPATPATFSDTDEQTLSFNSLTNVLTISKSNSQVDLSSLNNLYQAGTGLSLSGNTFANTGVLTVSANANSPIQIGGTAQNPNFSFKSGTNLGDYYSYNPATNSWQLTAAPINTTYTAGNGLTLSPTNQIGLGGTLTQPTTIATNSTNTLSITGLGTDGTSSNNLLMIDPATGKLTSNNGANLYWALGGNTLTSNQTLGTNNNYALIFKTDNQERMRLTEIGNLGLGTTAPVAKLNIQSTTEQLRLNYDQNNHLAFNTNNTGHTTIAATGTNSGITLKSNTGTTQTNTQCSAKFLEVDYNRAMNEYGGLNNVPNYPSSAFAFIKADGSIIAWGNANFGGSGAPTDSGYTKIYSNQYAFAALKSDGSIKAWGYATYGGSGAPTDTDYTHIYSTQYAFAALKADGSIKAWGDTNSGGSGAPTDSGYIKIYSNPFAFAALKADGSITVWGNASYGVSGAPTDTGYTQIYSTGSAFAALKADGSITAWGNPNYGGSGAPTDSGYTKIYSTNSAFAALKTDGSIKAWGDPLQGGSGAPSDSGYIGIYSTPSAFAALKTDGSIKTWGDAGSGTPSDTGYTKIYSAGSVQTANGGFVAFKPNGTIRSWGNFFLNPPSTTCVPTTISTATQLTLDTNGLTYSDSLNNLIFKADPKGVGNNSLATLTVNGSIDPYLDNTYSLGSATNRWKDLYLGPNSLHIGADATKEGLISWNATDATFNIATSAANGAIAFNTNQLYIDKQTGNVGIGKNNPAQRFQVYNGSTTGSYTTSGWTHSSDARLKTNIAALDNALEKTLSLNGVYFNWLASPHDNRQIGFIAQDVKDVLPEVVVGNDQDGYSLAYGNLTALTVEAIKQENQERKKQDDLLSLTIGSLQSDFEITHNSSASSLLEFNQNLTDFHQKLVSQQEDLTQLAENIATLTELTTQITTTLADHETRIRQLEELANLTSPSTSTTTDQQSIAGSESTLTKPEIALPERFVLLAKNLTIEQLQGGALSLDLNGNLKVKELQAETVVAGTYKVKNENKRNKILGETTISAGTKEVTIETDKLTDNSKIFISFSSNPEAFSWTEKIMDKSEANGFRIILSEPTKEDLGVSWWILEEN